MSHAEVTFERGPFDGRTEQWPIGEGFLLTVTIRPDHDPATLAVYRLRSVTLSTPRRIGYVYEGTVANPAA